MNFLTVLTGAAWIEVDVVGVLPVVVCPLLDVYCSVARRRARKEEDEEPKTVIKVCNIIFVIIKISNFVRANLLLTASQRLWVRFHPFRPTCSYS